ncbi:MAG: symmetrical bis(5'-nucleosyl)-tetraphosphatase [Betaproteobacteria bacterium]|nr:symmetrical bis(5'-nucleosyl)-tetraphosphatase [Betaproteobacteria bacterium]
MATYAIGDVQGCYDELRRLTDSFAYNPARDRIWFVGDLVNRGPRSLEVLRFARALGDNAISVLGNHDLHLLVVAEGLGKPRHDDTLAEVLAAPDRDELLAWLRARPLLHREGDYLLVHAGLLPGWNEDQAEALAREVESQLRGPRYREFLRHLYGSKPDRWSDALAGADRLRVIVNAMTRMRFCDAAGAMEFQTKGETAAAPEGYLPWFDVPGRATAKSVMVCGHWSALGVKLAPRLLMLDSGCVWGRSLTAIRLEDRRLFQVGCAARASGAQVS